MTVANGIDIPRSWQSLPSRQTIIDSFRIKASLMGQDDLILDARLKATERIEVDEKLSELRQRLDVSEAHLSLTIEGKNADERKARLVIALSEDERHQKLVKEVSELTAYQAELDADIVQLERQIATSSQRLRLVEVSLRFLAGESSPAE